MREGKDIGRKNGTRSRGKGGRSPRSSGFPKAKRQRTLKGGISFGKGSQQKRGTGVSVKGENQNAHAFIS